VLGTVTNPITPPGGSSTAATVTVAQYVHAQYGMSLGGAFPGAAGSLGMLVAWGGLVAAVSYAGLRWGRFQTR
jgi:hypothetical protein